ncbi:MAG: Rrf2 family transcriptional regulator [Ignavibacteria bacterium]|nr:Rrf2 family transcriptional regulator [Ignavibacteria bacterium]
MVRFSKKIEYALGTLQFLGMNPNEFYSARELSEILNIPYEFLSKTLAKLAKSKILNSNFGTKGGYQLSVNPKELKFSQILSALDEPINVVECVYGDEDICERSSICMIKTPMFQLQSKINELISSTTLEDLLNFADKSTIQNSEQKVKQVLG